MLIRDAIAQAIAEVLCIAPDEIPWRTPLHAITDSLDRIELRHKVADLLHVRDDDLEPLMNDLLSLEQAADLIEAAVNESDAASLRW